MRRRVLNAGSDLLRLRCPFFACAAVILSSALAGHGKPAASNVRPIDPTLQVASLVVRELAPTQPVSYLPAALEGSGYRLAPNDRALYRQLFDTNAARDYTAADQLLGRIEDSRLRGHVLAQRWLSDAATQPDFAGLKQWLDQYSDLPQAEQVLALAKAKRPAGAPLPKLGVPGSAAIAVERGVPEPSNRMAEIATQAFYDGDAKKALPAANAAAGQPRQQGDRHALHRRPVGLASGTDRRSLAPLRSAFDRTRPDAVAAVCRQLLGRPCAQATRRHDRCTTLVGARPRNTAPPSTVCWRSVRCRPTSNWRSSRRN